MSKLLLKDYKIRELYFKNRLTARAPIELEQRQSFNIQFIPGRDKCIGKCRIEINNKKEGQPFIINMYVEGIFSYESPMEKHELHNEVYKELFPYVRVLINNLTISAGIPPLFSQPIEIKNK